MIADTPLYHFGPTAQILVLGALIAFMPLGWAAWRFKGQGPGAMLTRLKWVTLFLTFDLLVFGAFTRLTDSGLGCPDWPGCYGQASPVGASGQIQAAQELMPTGPVTHGKAWIEMVHRYLATGVGGLILFMCAWAWLMWWRGNRQTPVFWPTFTLFWVGMQGAFGALTVTMKLLPAIVTLHLLGGVILLALLAHQSASANAAAAKGGPQGQGVLLVGMLVLLLQIALGGWVSTNYAVLVCDSFPTCQGSFWPDMSFAQGFEIWRPLGYTSLGELLSFPALTAIHYVHRLAAYGVIACLLAVAWWLQQRQLPSHAKALALLVLLQFLTGLSNVVLGWPMLAALLHTGGAATLLVVLVLAWHRTRLPSSASLAS
jgi:cytochrome c oxidase assembly protein subunit 15